MVHFLVFLKVFWFRSQYSCFWCSVISSVINFLIHLLYDLTFPFCTSGTGTFYVDIGFSCIKAHSQWHECIFGECLINTFYAIILPRQIYIHIKWQQFKRLYHFPQKYTWLTISYLNYWFHRYSRKNAVNWQIQRIIMSHSSSKFPNFSFGFIVNKQHFPTSQLLRNLKMGRKFCTC